MDHLKMIFLLKMGILQPAMLVYQRVAISSVQVALEDPIAVHIDPILLALNGTRLHEKFGDPIHDVQIQQLGAVNQGSWVITHFWWDQAMQMYGRNSALFGLGI